MVGVHVCILKHHSLRCHAGSGSSGPPIEVIATRECSYQLIVLRIEWRRHGSLHVYRSSDPGWCQLSDHDAASSSGTILHTNPDRGVDLVRLYQRVRKTVEDRIVAYVVPKWRAKPWRMTPRELLSLLKGSSWKSRRLFSDRHPELLVSSAKAPWVAERIRTRKTQPKFGLPHPKRRLLSSGRFYYVIHRSTIENRQNFGALELLAIRSIVVI